jgi:hypothetical protein
MGQRERQRERERERQRERERETDRQRESQDTSWSQPCWRLLSLSTSGILRGVFLMIAYERRLDFGSNGVCAFFSTLGEVEWHRPCTVHLSHMNLHRPYTLHPSQLSATRGFADTVHLKDVHWNLIHSWVPTGISPGKSGGTSLGLLPGGTHHKRRPWWQSKWSLTKPRSVSRRRPRGPTVDVG